LISTENDLLEKITLKFGKSPSGAPEVVNTTPVTVFVGPNNSGKSRVLSEIHRFCSSGQRSATDLILDDISFGPSSLEEAERKVEAFRAKPGPNETLSPGHIVIGKRGHRQNVRLDVLLNAIQNPQGNLNQYCGWYLSHQILNLNGANRIQLVNQQHAGNLQDPATTSFQMLFRDNAGRERVRQIVYEAFGEYLVIDPTNLGNLNLRLSKCAPIDEREERGIHEAAVDFHRAATPIDLASDGVKAFAGMLIEIVAGNPEVLLIDEPEAFLHPSLAFSLGNEIARISQGTDKRLFVSTHSASFVMGCIQSGAPVNIVRLTHRNAVATARSLSNDELLALMRNPLLRSTGVMAGLFYEYVVVTESDADRAFYQEVNERLLRLGSELGIPNCLFLNAQNKQTVQTILRPLRKLGIPAAGIIDVDVVKEGGTVFGSLLESLAIPEIEKTSLSTLRAALKQSLDATGKDFKREGGFGVLTNGDREAADNFSDNLEKYGLFLVRGGELESWLKHLGVGGHGPSWLIKMFEKMGENPNSSDYLKPANGDVWQFIGQIKKWFANSGRRGIPS
jgi:ABC-type cobalamin/Fe3+-siderophores transport system ATPase subunit